MESSDKILRPIDLRGVRVWLSGAVPEPKVKPDTGEVVEVWKGSDAEAGILAFVQIFSALVFKYGGEVIHGCHPSFTPILLEQARRYLAEVEPNTQVDGGSSSDSGRHNSPLHLLVSEYFASDRSRRDWKRWEQFSSVELTEKTGATDEDRDPSLEILRKRMSTQCSAFVAIGGKWWDDVPGRAGIPIEFNLAKGVGVPCFVVGGFGGISSEFAKQSPDWYEGLGNKLSNEDNQFLASNTNFNLIAGVIVSQLNAASDEASGEMMLGEHE